MNTVSKKIPSTGLKTWIVALMAAVGGASQAAVRVGDSSATGVAEGKTPELMLVIWDPVKEVSYTKDLGITVYAENYASGNAATNLFVYGQQDAGYQQLFAPLNTDANFQSFLTKSSNVSDQIWAILAVSSDPNGVGQGSRALYTTLNAATPTGTTNPEYTRLTTWAQGNFGDAEGSLESFYADVSTQCGAGSCQTDFGANLSSYNVKGQLSYAGSAFSSTGALAGASTTYAANVFNKVNSSSWFYQLGLADDQSDPPVVVDEFDNLSHDAYWGLGVNAQGEYILSYTLEASQTQAQTMQGQMLRLRTDFAANYGGTRFIGAPVGDTLNLGGGAAITPVPEPSTWGLMGLGLALLAGRARRQKNA